VPVNKTETVPSSNLVPFAMASGSGQSFFGPYALCSNDEEYLSLTMWLKRLQDKEIMQRTD